MNREEYTNDDRRKGVQVAGPGVERSGTMAGARPGAAGPGITTGAGPGITDSAMIHIPLEDDIDRQTLFGSMDANLQLIREATGVDIIQRDDGLTLKGPAKYIQDARRILEELETMIRKGEKIDSQKLHYVIALESEGVSYGEHNVSGDTIAFTCQGRPIKPKTIGQKRYVNSIRKRDVVFAIGPAGTGKTYLAVAMAVRAMKNKEVQKIILARPAVEAGENLGFLPGDLQDKVDPYLRPLYDALYDMLGREKALALKEKEIIEVVPLAYMRGRTLDDAFIILDEAQNTTREQMKMFLTRMGFGSKIVVTGDVTQIDLPKGRKSGLVEAEKILKDVKGIDFCYLKGVDVVRHEMVKRIISAYDEYYKNHPDSRSDSGARRRNGQK
ncbi:phosphate starvation-inducible protein PhoH [Eubacterium pyruvativorans]|uniref:PhoH-like protein n=2 Tax=Eubacterium pyruvativorans TaxID=155865 RepID=A0A1I7G8D7_9FIRM|nr:phosphate starvation-inducible protein PhoH [Eubacterium pyruvativorans]SFU44516.1 phosphate starvation-inducible protein PhoH [Eubacterium pyruvativorans]